MLSLAKPKKSSRKIVSNVWVKRAAPFVLILLAVFAFQALQPKKALATPNNACIGALYTLCNYNTNGWQPFPPNTMYDEPVLQIDGGESTVVGGSTINLTLGYNSFHAAPGANPHIITWANINSSGNIGSSYLSSITMPAGDENAKRSDINTCFNEVVSNDSPYFNSTWYNPNSGDGTSAGGGKFLCDQGHYYSPWGTPVLAGGWDPSKPSESWSRGGSGEGMPAGIRGASALWYQNSDPGRTNPRYHLKLVTKSVATTKTFCLRTHISITNHSQAYFTTRGYGDLSREALPDVKGAFGAGAGSNSPQCFNIIPAPPPPPTNTTCTTLKVHDFGLRNTSDAPTPMAPDGQAWAVKGPGEWGSNTIVKVSDSSGHVFVDKRLGNGEHKDGTGGSTPYTYTPQGKSIIVNISRQMHIQSHSGKWYWMEYSTEGSGTYDCYAATCRVNSVVGDGPGGIVLAGHPYKVEVAITNVPAKDAGPGLTLPANLGGANLSATAAGDQHPTGFYIVPGDTRPTSFYLTAPGGPDSQTPADPHIVNPYPDYWGNFVLGPACPPSFTVYQEFNAGLGASAAGNPTDENPASVTYSTTVGISGTGAPVNIPTSSLFYKIPFGGAQSNLRTNAGGTYQGPLTYALEPGGPGNYPVASVVAGDKYCSQISATYTHGFVGPGGVVVYASNPGSAGPSCFNVHNKPYFKAYGGGAAADGAFSSSGSCSVGANNGLLASWNDNTNQDRGASAQLSALALIKITGFASAQIAAGGKSTDLTFANRGVPVTADRESPTLGGSFGGSGHCLPDATASSSSTILPDKSIVNIPPLNPGENKSVFVDGDVYINGNITYNPGWVVNADGTTNVPSFVLHATGNIYIAPNVTELSGVYIGKGKIYTCAQGFTYMPAPNIYNDCNKQLTVYGAFVATQINLMRSYGSLRNATATEKPDGPSHVCATLPGSGGSGSGDGGSGGIKIGGGKVGGGGASGNQPVCAAEIFRFSPEMYLSNPAVRPPSNGATQYDAITSLPPVL